MGILDAALGPDGVLRRLLHDVGGSTALEYAFVASLISILIVAGVTIIGAETRNSFEDVNAAFSAN